jgi:NAD(P)H-quinone oxidoreductase subunit 6
VTLADLLFYGVAAATLATAAYAVFSRNIVRAVFSLLGTFFGVAIIYGMLAADFVAVVQLMVYVGGILVLLLFAVMLTSRIEETGRSNRTGNWLAGSVIGLSTAGLLVTIAVMAPWRTTIPGAARPMTEAIGRALIGPALLPFLLTSFVLLGATVGAVTLARRGRGRGASV